MNLRISDVLSMICVLVLACSLNTAEAQQTRSSQLGTMGSALLGPPESPGLMSPSHRAVAVRINPTFVWHASSGADSYEIRIGTDSTFFTNVIARATVQDTSYYHRGLSHATWYYWQVRALKLGTVASVSETFQFRSRLTPGVDPNGEISSAMAYQILKHATGIQLLTGDAFEVAEVSGDWTLSCYDAALVLKAAAGFLTVFPVDQ